MTGRLILVRHGETTANVRHSLDTRPPGAPLTELGRSQARAVGERLAEIVGARDGTAGRLTGVHTSEAVRARTTGILLARSMERYAGLPPDSVPVTPRAGLHEFSAGDLEDRTDATSIEMFRSAHLAALSGDPAGMTPGGENITDFLGRYRTVIEGVVLPEMAGRAPGDAVVVVHASAMRLFARHATGIAVEDAHPLPNTGVIILEPGDAPFGRWRLTAWDHRPR
ncbi:histidine phosphatase family protein [Corynebacterium pygosceleis]|uniref:Histidine phosphatase family protein n=1 Tax=Corynebacterium pygosceleis TaxID=2800406 RepID=A0A9Q4C7E4_9CORY|nr:histidine phosphatase family protein [Corynebacterium pygosceleis]MCK7637094.1 histidine phosphatase family protein [Corynebacterium pygosceleis]MCK7674568.1 histidine phosphatase family protein [Corynebacterium pygosceleis]MCL0120130.1 histidine phosphatase family protein [Corynebacterium pygosceleis]MCX7467847.1 histidine phosphatase family protein [Corynebacterium pygosceleis]